MANDDLEVHRILPGEVGEMILRERSCPDELRQSQYLRPGPMPWDRWDETFRHCKPGDRFLLIRVLQNDDTGDHPNRPATTEDYLKYVRPNRTAHGKRVIIPSRTVCPSFKVLLFPFRLGDELPRTTWNKAHAELTVAWKDQVDVYTFRRGDDGRTRLTLRRGEPQAPAPADLLEGRKDAGEAVIADVP